MSQLLDLVLHIDVYLETLFVQIGSWIYVVLFAIIFAETGFVVTPFLPGDSLLFAVGALSSRDLISPWCSFFIIAFAAILGNVSNYHIGRFVGPKIFHEESSRFFNKKHLESTRKFYEKHGSKAIVIARFLPIFRTFVPFVAGIGRMSYHRFLVYNALGGLLWSASLVGGGYYFGNIPFVKKHFSLFIVGIVVVSIMPALIKVAMFRLKKSVPSF